MAKFLTAEGLTRLLQKLKNAVAGMVAAASDLCVHKSGNETVAGTKTFTGQIVCTGDKGTLQSGMIFTGERQNFFIDALATSVTKGTAPSENHFWGINFYGKDNANYTQRIGMLETGLSTANLASTAIRAYNCTTNTNNSTCSITAYVDGEGNAYTAAPTPAAGDSSTKIATTAFVANAAVYKTGDQSIAGVKTFTDVPHVSNVTASIGLHTTDFTRGTNPTTSRWGGIYICDKSMDTATTKRYSCYEANVATNGNATSYLRSYLWNASGTTNTYLLVAHPLSGTAYTETSAYFRPSSNGSLSLGDSSHRWSAVYAANATIQTSDERLKQDIEDIPDEVLDAWDGVKWKQFRMKESVASKGNSARIHSGIVAQQASNALGIKGIDASRYGFFCYDEWEAQEARLDSDGNPENEAVPAGNQYSMRYEEALAIEAAYQRRRADRLEEKVSRLEARLERLEALEK